LELLFGKGHYTLATHTKGGRKKSYFQKETYKETLNPQTNSIIKNLIQGDSRRKDNERKEITHLYNATIVTRWDTLRNFVQLDEKNTRGKIRGTMPMQSKMKSHPQR
jgi:hypothetical protein